MILIHFDFSLELVMESHKVPNLDQCTYQAIWLQNNQSLCCPNKTKLDDTYERYNKRDSDQILTLNKSNIFSLLCLSQSSIPHFKHTLIKP